MEIRINNALAYLKKDASFEFVAENRMFTGSDSYTLTITFPLKGCRQNTQIFGHIERTDVDKGNAVFDCEIRDRSFFKAGTLVVTEINEVEVKTQFLEGRCAQNYDTTFDDIYINEFKFLVEESDSERAETPTIPDCWAANRKYVVIPWVNNASGNIQNELVYNANTKKYTWKSPQDGFSYMPYLYYIIELICQKIGYTVDLGWMKGSQFGHLLICNAVPAAWTMNYYNFASALPHWSLTDFFEQVGRLMFGEFDIDHKKKHIAFQFHYKLQEQSGEVKLDNVIDSYTAEVSQEEKSQYIGRCNLKFAENGSPLWPYLSCEWYMRSARKNAKRFDTMKQLLSYASQYKVGGRYSYTSYDGSTRYYLGRGYPRDSPAHGLFYAKDVDTYFIMYCYNTVLAQNVGKHKFYYYYNRLQPVNIFGDRIIDEDLDTLECKITPAWIDDTDDEHGPCIFNDCGDTSGLNVVWNEEAGRFEYEDGYYAWKLGDEDEIDYDSGALVQSLTGRMIAKGKGSVEEHFTNLNVAFWEGRIDEEGKQPCPMIDRIRVTDDFKLIGSHCDMRLNNRQEDYPGDSNPYDKYKIDGKTKYTFSFLSKTIPDPKAVFYIRGKKFLCEKITATFREDGMSQKMKGVFYKIVN